MAPGFLITAKTVRGYVQIFQSESGTSTSSVQMVRLRESDVKAFPVTVLFCHVYSADWRKLSLGSNKLWCNYSISPYSLMMASAPVPIRAEGV